METVLVLGVIVILIGGYLRYHRARIYPPAVSHKPLPMDDPVPMETKDRKFG
jgi:hypothetical protein